MELEAKFDRLRAILHEMQRVLVAYSGGVDSTFLLRVAALELGDHAVALTTKSPTAADDDCELAITLAREFGVRHIIIDANELEIAGYAENPTNRCYFCKSNLYEICAAELPKLGIEHVVDGANLDDLGDYRPGLTAAAEHSIRHPLVEAGLTKQDIRDLSRSLGLPTWDKPSSPCLSSRFPYGTAITEEGLRRVAGGERLLHDLGFRECRVRYHETIARIEVTPHEIARFADEAIRTNVVQRFKSLGFLYVTLDLQGFRSGSLNEALRPTGDTTPPNAGRRASSA